MILQSEQGQPAHVPDLHPQRNKVVVLPTPDDFADRSTAPAGGCAL